ncbi:MAG: hypothetical protein KJ990_00205 [Proteobacteria bacterium]|nr:hypothetical protein [Pseudomonadota bacterium]MBU1648351.1 hypothetical protein [Pseudomonadota bacterium]
MMGSAQLIRLSVSSFDPLVEHLSKEPTSFTEEEALKHSFWDRGEEARLREDFRFRQTPWGRWIISDRLLANDELYNLFHRKAKSSLALDVAFYELGSTGNKAWTFCKADKRFFLDNGHIRLAESELSNKMMMEEAAEIEKYATHLPVHSLEAVAASEPTGEWGPHAQEEMVETLGWVKVSLPEQKLNDKMFVARIQGNSMNDSRSGLIDGSYAVFELWPAGTRQNKILLVQGTFKDPETGSYAVKKYSADPRDQEGIHHRITLASLNSDKEKYPDIVLDPEDDESVKVMALFITSLSGRQYARQPKPAITPGRRNLNPELVAARMLQRVEAIFEKQIEERPGKLKRANQIRLVCLEFEAGGLHVETDPQAWLPNFVKKVVLKADARSWTVLAANLKNLTWRQEVPPSINGYQWTAPGFEDDVEDEFVGLRLSGLSETAVTLFKIDALGVGRQVMGDTLTPGQEYKIIIPPKLIIQDVPIGTWNFLNRDWQLWELAIPSIVDDKLLAIFEKFNLSVGKAAPRLEWVITPPNSYVYTTRGEAIPCYAPGISLYVSVKGISTVLPEEARVFVINDSKTASFPLPRGNEWTFALEELVAGRGLISVMHNKTEIGSAELPFCIIDKDPEPISAIIEVEIKGKKRESNSDGDIYYDGDLRCLGNDDFDFGVKAPPLWSVSAKWESVDATDFPTRFCESTGDYISNPLLEDSKQQREFQAPGNLVLDFVELGRVVLRHYPVPDPDLIRHQFIEIIESAGESLPTLKGQFQILRRIWFDPLLRAMGFSIVELQEEDLRSAPLGVIALLLKKTTRKKEKIESTKDKVVVMVSDQSAIPVTGQGSAREYANGLCERHEIKVALITDGRYWMHHKHGARLKAHISDLFEVVRKGEGEDDFESFLSEVGGL